MSTLRQIEANRRNAQKSTGPTSATGKAASSMNALKTGLHAKSLVLPSENLADFDRLVDEYYLRHPPATPEARCLVDDLIRCEWTLRRIDAAEAQTWIYQTTSSYREAEKYPLGKSATSFPSTFTKLQYRIDSTRRAFHRTLQALKQLEAEAAVAPAPSPIVEPENPLSLTPSPQTASPQIGFVLPTPAPVSPAPGMPDCDSTRRPLPSLSCR
jgi:hypothetical protein